MSAKAVARDAPFRCLGRASVRRLFDPEKIRVWMQAALIETRLGSASRLPGPVVQ